MMRPRLFPIVVAAGLLAAGVASAQEPQGDAGEHADILVQGEAIRAPDEVRAAVRHMSEPLALDEPLTGPHANFKATVSTRQL